MTHQRYQAVLKIEEEIKRKKYAKKGKKYKKTEVFEEKEEADIKAAMATLAHKFAELIKECFVIYRYKINSRRNIARLKSKQLKAHKKVLKEQMSDFE